MIALYLISGLVLGFFITYFLNLSQKRKKDNQLHELEKNIQKKELELKFATTELQKNNTKIKELENKTAESGKTILEIAEEKGRTEALLKALQKNIDELDKSLSKIITEKEKIQISLIQASSENSFLNEKLENQKKEILELQQKFKETFENLANRIFEEKSEKFIKQNKQNIDDILKPLKDEIGNFQKKVEDSSEKNQVSNATLIERLKHLEKLNKKISDDANNLTKALKGDVKTQGNWGELILERILENSGLRNDIEYTIQAKGMGLKNDDEQSMHPDIIINLPENKHLIIDSKVSLISYEKYINSINEIDKAIVQKEILRSIKNHIAGLHEKHYQKLKGLNSPDFVLMFIPIEGSFALLGNLDSHIFDYALEKNIVIVSPSTLLASLRTISFIWRQENQTKNALEIATQSGNLYDAFVRLIDELDKIDIHLKRTQTAYDDVMKKLSTGRGNLISRVEKIKKLGAKTSKKIPDKYIEEQTDILENKEETN